MRSACSRRTVRFGLIVRASLYFFIPPISADIAHASSRHPGESRIHFGHEKQMDPGFRRDDDA
jgi:hypothetical protein